MTKQNAGRQAGKPAGRISNLIALLALLACWPAGLRAAPALQLGAEPYGLISWTGLNGEAELGAGLNLTATITKNLSLVSFAEADDVDNLFIERAGLGLRYTAWLGKKASLDAGVAGAYDLEHANFFLRLPLGANLYAWKSKNADLGLRAQYAFDLDGNGKTGTATGRFFAGPFFNYRW